MTPSLARVAGFVTHVTRRNPCAGLSVLECKSTTRSKLSSQGNNKIGRASGVAFLMTTKSASDQENASVTKSSVIEATSPSPKLVPAPVLHAGRTNHGDHMHKTQNPCLLQKVDNTCFLLMISLLALLQRMCP